MHYYTEKLCVDSWLLSSVPRGITLAIPTNHNQCTNNPRYQSHHSYSRNEVKPLHPLEGGVCNEYQLKKICHLFLFSKVIARKQLADYCNRYHFGPLKMKMSLYAQQNKPTL